MPSYHRVDLEQERAVSVLEGAALPSSLFVAVVLLLGGGGSTSALAETTVRLCSIAVLALLTIRRRSWVRYRLARVPIYFLGGLWILVGLQLLPLPTPLIASLPGQSLRLTTQMAAGLTPGWQPISLDPEATLWSGLSLVVPTATFLLAVTGPRQGLMLLLRIVLGVALVHAVMGLLQIASGGDTFYAYAEGHRGVAAGLFANRNHFAALMVVAMPIAGVALGVGRTGEGGLMRLALLVSAELLLLGALVASGSRTGTAIGLAALPASILLSGCLTGRGLRLAVLAALVALGGAVIVVFGTDAGERLVSRFGEVGADERNRMGMWEDAVFAIRQYLPFGSGLGTFQPVLNSVERLSELGTNYANHAHNDYLELIVETGVVGAACILAYLIWLGGWVAALLRKGLGSDEARISAAAITGLLALLLHSALDYPLRTEALAGLFGLLSGIVARSSQDLENTVHRISPGVEG